MKLPSFVRVVQKTSAAMRLIRFMVIPSVATASKSKASIITARGIKGEH